MSKANGEVRLYLDHQHSLARHSEDQYIGDPPNDKLPKLNNAKYLTLIGASLGNHNLKQDEKSSYFTTFLCQFGQYRYKQLPFGAALAGVMLQRKIDEIFKDMPNVFGIVDDILVAGYAADGKDHDKTVWRCCRDVSRLI